MRREKVLVHSEKKDSPGNWIAPPGSNRSGGGGNEAAGASGVEGRIRRLGESAGCNPSERRAGLETDNAGADPTVMWGRPTSRERYERISSISPAGGVATTCRHRGPGATREAPAEIILANNVGEDAR